MDSSESLIKTIFENKGYQTDSESQRIYPNRKEK